MKTEILSGDNPQSINWGKVQLVRCDECIVLTNGRHTKDGFEGTVLHDGIDGYEVAANCTGWDKSAFTPLPSPVTIKFEF